MFVPVSIGAIMMIKLEEVKIVEDNKTDVDNAGKNIGLDRYISTHM